MRERPGVFRAHEAWWERRTLRLPAEEKRTRAVRRARARRRAGGVCDLPAPVEWEDGVSSGAVEVSRRSARPRRRRRRSGASCSTSTGTATIEVELLPLDHPLFLLLANPRRLRFRSGDSLWIRLVDVGAALSGREYAGDGALVFEVRTPCARGTRGGGSSTAASRREPKKPPRSRWTSMRSGSAYLGAVSFAQLATALRLEELVGRCRRARGRAVRVAPAALVPRDFLS